MGLQNFYRPQEYLSDAKASKLEILETLSKKNTYPQAPGIEKAFFKRLQKKLAAFQCQ